MGGPCRSARKENMFKILAIVALVATMAAGCASTQSVTTAYPDGRVVTVKGRGVYAESEHASAMHSEIDGAGRSVVVRDSSSRTVVGVAPTTSAPSWVMACLQYGICPRRGGINFQTLGPSRVPSRGPGIQYQVLSRAAPPPPKKE